MRWLLHFVIAVTSTVTRAPSITYTGCHTLWAYFNASIGLGNGAALLVDGNKTLVKYTVTEGKFRMMFNKELPSDMADNCRKYLLANGRILLRNVNKDPTVIYTDELEKIYSYSGGYGNLIGTLSPDHIVYAKKSSSGQSHELHIYSAGKYHQRVMVLQPSGGRKWSESLSVCQHPKLGLIAVVGHSPNFLDVFNAEGGSLYSKRCLYLQA